MKDRGEEYGYIASMSKFLASEVAMKVTEKSSTTSWRKWIFEKFPVERIDERCKS